MLLNEPDYLLVALCAQIQCGPSSQNDIDSNFELLFSRFIVQHLLNGGEVLLLRQQLNAGNKVGPFGQCVFRQQRTSLLGFEFFGYATVLSHLR